jgi:hypothetical protein
MYRGARVIVAGLKIGATWDAVVVTNAIAIEVR